MDINVVMFMTLLRHLCSLTEKPIDKDLFSAVCKGR